MKKKFLLDTYSARKFVETIAGVVGMSVEFSIEPIQPRTCPVSKKIWVESPKWDWDEITTAKWWGELLHELGHHRGDNGELMQFFAATRLNTRSFKGTVVNILLDYINDGQWFEEYRGAHRNVEAAQRFYCERGVTRVERDTKDGVQHDPKTASLCRIFSWIYSRRAATYQRGLAAAAARWLKVRSFDELTQFNAELEALTDGASVDTLADKIVALDPPTDEPAKGKGPVKGEPELTQNSDLGDPKKSDDSENGGNDDEQDDEQDDQQDDSDTEDRGEGSDAPDEGDDGEGGAQDAPEEDVDDGEGSGAEVWVSYRDLLIADNHATKGEPGKIRIRYDHEPKHNYVPFNTYIEMDLETGKEILK